MSGRSSWYSLVVGLVLAIGLTSCSPNNPPSGISSDFVIIEAPSMGWWAPLRDAQFLWWTWPRSAPVSPVLVIGLLGLVATLLFLLWERHRERVRRSALLDLSLFTLPRFSWGNVTAAMVAIGEFALIFVLPLYLTFACGLSVLQSGFVLAAMAIGAFLAGAQARHLAARIGPAGVVVLGLGLEVVGIAVMTLLLAPSVSVWVMTIPLVVYGLGLGLASAQLTSLVLADIPADQSGQGSAPKAQSVKSVWLSGPQSLEHCSPAAWPTTYLPGRSRSPWWCPPGAS